MTNFEPQYPRGGHGIPSQPDPAYQHPGSYQPPGYPQPGYRQPPYGPPLRRPTNTMAILAIVFAFVFPPLGIVFGIVGRNQIKRTGEEGSGLALAGLILGSVFTALIVAYFVVAVIAISLALDGYEIPDQQ